MIQHYLDDRILGWSKPFMAGLQFGSYALQNHGVTVWIDAVDPGKDLDEVLHLGPPEHLLITFGDHDRDVAALAKRFGAQIWVPEGGTQAFAKADHVYGEGDALPAGLRALPLPGVGYGDSVLYGEVEGQRVGFFGDSVFHEDLNQVSWLARLFGLRCGRGPFQRKSSFRGGNKRQAMHSFSKILDLDLDAAFCSHGTPVVGNAAALLQDSIQSW